MVLRAAPARRLAGALVALAALCVAVPAAQARVPAPDDDPFYAVPGNVGTLADGAIIASRSITATAMSVPMPAKAWQVLYKTVDNTGTPTATVTTIMVPDARWTGAGPRPVVSYQTAEDGAGTKCAPSYAIRGGLAAASNSSAETLLMLQALQRGWTVVAPDYEGPRSMFLGAEGEARGVLDGLRAARAFAPAGIDPSAPLGLWGYSGGGFASSVAAQMQPRHAPELKLSGVALGGVVADLRATIHAFSGSAVGGALITRTDPRGEDDGYLLALWWNPETGLSELLIHDASDLVAQPLARVGLPVRVPFGFHGSWADQTVLDKSVSALRDAH